MRNKPNYWAGRRISRRRALRGGTTGLAGLVGAVLIGCGADDEPTSASGATTAAGTSASGGTTTTATGGTLVLRDIPQTQDFHRHTGTMPTPSIVCDCPTAIDGEGATQNFLLERVEAPDASNYTLTFRPGIKFHNGREMTSEDVKLNLKRIAATDGTWLKSVADSITSMETPDERTIVVALNEPYSPMLSLLSELWLMAPESPGWDGTVTTPIGTGPFVWKEWVPNDRIVLERFPDYWQAGRPSIDGIEIRNLEGDASTILLAGDVHIAGVSRDQRELIGSNPDIELQQEKATSWQFLSFNNRQPRAPYDDIRVRRALAHALDKAALNEFANGDTGVVADQMAPPGSFYWSDEIEDPYATPDLAAARQLLDAAGYSDGELQPVMPVNTNPAQPEVVAAQLAQIGVTPKLEVADDVTTETRLQAWDWDIYYAGSGTRSDIALRFVRLMSDGPNPGLWGGPQDPEYDRLVREAWASVDAEDRKARYLDAWKIVMERLYTIVTYHRSGTTGIRKEVGGWQTGSVANFNRIDGGVAHITIQA